MPGWETGNSMGILFGHMIGNGVRWFETSRENNGIHTPALIIEHGRPQEASSGRSCSSSDTQLISAVEFTDLRLDPGRDLYGATVEFEVAAIDERSQAEAFVTIYGDTSPSALPISLDSTLSTLSPTQATVMWQIPPFTEVGQVVRTPEIGAIVREIMAVPGWTVGSPVIILFSPSNSTGTRALSGGISRLIVTPNIKPGCHIDAGGTYNTGPVPFPVIDRTCTAMETVGSGGSSGDVQLTPTSLRLMNAAQMAAVVFPSITVQAGALVTNAYVLFDVKALLSPFTEEDIVVQIHGELARSAGLPQAASQDLSARPRTIASVDWAIPASVMIHEELITPDLSPILAEILNGNWTSGNSVALLFTHVSGTGYRVVETARINNGVMTPTLVIDALATCPAGTADLDGIGATACSICPAGRASVPGSVTCTVCPAGTADADQDPASPCQTCAPGSVSTAEAVECTLCDSGKYDHDENAATACKACDAGQFSLAGAASCEDCVDGSYAAEGAAVCVACAPGFSDDDRQPSSRCRQCGGGRYSPHTGLAGECIACEQGRFASTPPPHTDPFVVPGAAVCSVCNAGTFSEEAAAACDFCQPGSADLDEDASTPCEPCHNGTYSGCGSTECDVCDAGTSDADHDQATACEVCQAGHDYVEPFFRCHNLSPLTVAINSSGALLRSHTSSWRFPVTASVNSRQDSAKESVHSGVMNLASSDLELMHDGEEQVVGIVFPSVNVPPGASITSAQVLFDIDEVRPGQSDLPVTITIYGEASPAANAISTEDFDLTARLPTASSVIWQPEPSVDVHGDLLTPDISTIISEIVSLSGWKSGNRLTVLFGQVSGTGTRWVESARVSNDVQTPALLLEYGPSFQPVDDAPTALVNCSDSATSEENGTTSDVRFANEILGLTHGGLIVGIVFAGVEVPQGATIRSAQMVFHVAEARAQWNSTVTLSIYGEASVTPAAPRNVSGDLSSRIPTTSSVIWQPGPSTVGSDLRTPDLSSIVSEIVGLPAWSSSSDLALMISHVSGTGGRWVDAATPTLLVEYAEVDVDPGAQQISMYETEVMLTEQGEHTFVFEASDTVYAQGDRWSLRNKCGELLVNHQGQVSEGLIVAGQAASFGFRGSLMCCDDASESFVEAACNACPAGKADTDKSSVDSACELCPIGSYSPMGSTECSVCQAGRSDDDGDAATPCRDCEPGFAITAEAASAGQQCSRCPSGTYSPAGSVLCAACDPGRLDHDYDASTPCMDQEDVAVAAEIVLNLDIEQVAEGTQSRDVFEQEFQRDMAAQLSTGAQIVDADQIRVTGIAGGSVRVSFVVRPSESGTAPTAEELVVSFASGATIAGVTAEPIEQSTVVLEAVVSCTQACQAGHEDDDCDEGTPCSECSPGKFSGGGVGAANRCSLCARGKHQSSPGMRRCNDCGAGTFTQRGSPECISCAPGRFDHDTESNEGSSAATPCEACAPGKFQDGLGEESCADCPRGRFLSTPGSAGPCVDCPPGKVVTQPGMSECDDCAAGQYQPVSGKELCELCAPGLFNNRTGSANATACLPCAAGRWTRVSNTDVVRGETQCTDCSVGSYRRVFDYGCQPCDNDAYKCSQPGLTIPQAAPGYYAPPVIGGESQLQDPNARAEWNTGESCEGLCEPPSEAEIAACKTAAGQDFLSQTGTEGPSPCRVLCSGLCSKLCSPNEACTGTCNMTCVASSRGADGNYRVPTAADSEACIGTIPNSDGTCAGGCVPFQWGDGSAEAVDISDDSTAFDGPAPPPPDFSVCPGGRGQMSCKEGHEGDRCAACVPYNKHASCSDDDPVVVNGYYRLDGRCKPCPCGGLKLWQSLSLAVLVMVLLLLVLERIMRNVRHVSTIIAPMSIVVTFAQTLALLLELDVPWPDQLKELLSTFNILNLNVEVLHPECSRTFDVNDKLNMALLTPVLLTVIVALYACAQLLAAKHGDAADHAMFLAKHYGKGPYQYVGEQLIVIVASLFVFCSIFFLRSVLQVFNCSSPDYANGGKQFIRIQPDRECDLDDEWYFAVWKKGLAGVFFYLLVFAGFCYGVYHNRDLFGFLGDKFGKSPQFMSDLSSTPAAAARFLSSTPTAAARFLSCTATARPD